MTGYRECPQCASHDVYSRLLFPRENFVDLECECLECGCLFDVVDGTTVVERDGNVGNSGNA
jgi:Zn ribbon nucleic-acid-binding protein